VVVSITQCDRWPGLDLRHLAALEAVARTCSFAAAARELGYTQPAVSQQIQALERIVGHRLLERGSGPRGVTTTEAGRLLLRHAQAIVARLSAAQADMQALADGAAGTLRVGTFQSVASRVLPTLVQRFAADWPGIEVQLTEDDKDEHLLELVERGELDLTFAMYPFPDGPFESAEVLRDPYVLVVQADSPLAAGLAALDGVRELSLISYRTCRSASIAENHLRSLGIEPRVVFRSDDNGTVQSFVRSGFGCALVPALAVDREDPNVAVLELLDFPPRVLGIAWHRDRHRTPAARAFVDLALEPEVARI
jgi:molybdate transport repressor ModE-like protein